MTVHVIIPTNQPMNMVLRSLRYDSPLQETLKSRATVLGGGQGVRSNYIDVKINQKDTTKCIEAIERKLRKLGAPHGTRLISGVWSKALYSK